MDVAMAPTAVDVRDTAEYVERLRSLRTWAGRPSLRRLAALAGTTTTRSGHVVDRLPPSTTSDTLNGKRLPNLPRMELVEAFVTACLEACRLPQNAIDAAVGQWLAEWRRLANRTATAHPTTQAPTRTAATPRATGRGTAPATPPAPPPATAAGTVATPDTPAGAVSRPPRPSGTPAGSSAVPAWPSDAASEGERRLVGRAEALRVIDEALDGIGGGSRFVAITGEPGAGKTRLLGALAAGAERRGLASVRGRAGEFEQSMPLGVFVDALNDDLNGRADLCRRDRLGEGPARLLASVFPALAPHCHQGGPAPAVPLIGPQDGTVARYQLYCAVCRLLEEMAGPSGLVLILDDLHWADEASIELFRHLLRHPPRARVLVAVAYRPAQTEPRLTALVGSAEGGHHVEARPLTPAETAAFLGAGVGPAECRALHAASGGNPFYLDALVRMGGAAADGEDPAEAGELPAAVQVALRVEFDRLSPRALRVAEAAAVLVGEFEPATVAVAARMDDEEVLEALDELAADDLMRLTASGRRFQFRHPIVRNAAYRSAAPGRRLAAHARVARHLAELGVPATVRAHHVERSGRFGDKDAVATLADAAGAVACQAPATAAHWLSVALQLLPHAPEDIEVRRGLLVQLAQARLASGRLTESRAAARKALRLFAADDHVRRSRTVQVYALAERLLGHPEESRALLLAWLRRLPEHELAASVPVRARLVGESLFRGDFRAAQSFLDSLPPPSERWDPAGQHHAVTMILSGQARVYGMLGRLARERATATEAMEAAEFLRSPQLMAIAVGQAAIVTAWSGDTGTAVRLGERGVELAGRTEEWWGAVAWHTWGLVLINAGRLDQGADAVSHACDGFRRPRLDQFSLLSSCEQMAYAETARGRPGEAARWADRADEVAHPDLGTNAGLVGLARAHALRHEAPARAAEHARDAAGALATVGQHVDRGRAHLAAGVAHRDIGEHEPAREQFEQAAEIFHDCGAQDLRAQALRELHRLQRRLPGGS
jgi:tetratricopeptide (TPR) repeat protein